MYGKDNSYEGKGEVVKKKNNNFRRKV